MAAAPPSDDPSPTSAPPAGWLLRVDRSVLDVGATLAEHGQLYRCPIAPGPTADALAPGQPCFLARTDRNGVVGLWAVGEVVAPVLHLPAGTPVLPAEVDADPAAARCYAEVELLPLAKPIAASKLAEDEALAGSPLTETEGDVGPWPLTGAHVRAIEALEFWIDPPTDEQRAALDALLAAEDELLPDES